MLVRHLNGVKIRHISKDSWFIKTKQNKKSKLKESQKAEFIVPIAVLTDDKQVNSRNIQRQIASLKASTQD